MVLHRVCLLEAVLKHPGWSTGALDLRSPRHSVPPELEGFDLLRCLKGLATSGS